MPDPNPQYSANTDFRTSKGNVAPDLHLVSGELTPAQIDDAASWINAQFPAASVVRDATCTYNCHGYAHAARHAWFNSVDQFLADDYEQYTPATLQVDDRVVYTNGGVVQHSGIITQTVGSTAQQIRSKWGMMSEVLHSATDVPSSYGAITYYLRPRGRLSVTETEQSDRRRAERIDDLVFQVTSREVMTLVRLASTPEALIASLRAIPVFTELQLAGNDAVRALRTALARAEGSSVIPLFFAAGVMRNPEVLEDLARHRALLTHVSMGSEVLEWAIIQCLPYQDRRRLAADILSRF